MNTMLKTGLLAIAMLAYLHCGSADATYDDEAQSQDGLVNTGGDGADGDSCSIDRNGLKVPGTKKGTQCCSVFDTADCVDLPTPAPTSTGKTTRPLLPPVGRSRSVYAK